MTHAFNPLAHPDHAAFHLSLACHHCEDPACLRHCPVRAYRKDPATGAVLLDPDRCMGCRYCAWACPHDAPRFDEGEGRMEKCTFCVHRLDRGEKPACVARCPLGALGVEERQSPAASSPPPGFPPSRLAPSIRFLPVREGPPPLTARAPSSALAPFWKELVRVPQPKITLRGEWALVVFTTVLALLVARMGAAALGHPLARPWLWLGPGILAFLLSGWHLGRPSRAWRALANLSGSWLSREIALASLFLGLAMASCLLPGSRALAWASLGTGLAALYAVDRVYQVAVQAGPGNFHSAHVLFNGLYFLGLLAWWPLAAGAGLLKAALYLARKAHFRLQGRDPAWPLSSLRLLLGFVLPAAGGPWGLLAALAGDLLDRCEYYQELEVPTPGSTLARDLEAARG
jgi:ferredoxin